MLTIEADLISTIASFSRAGDLNNLTFLAHAERVAHIAFGLGRMLSLSEADLNELTISALLHDIGIMTDQEQLHLADLEPQADRVSPHCKKGYELLKHTQTFGSYAENVLKHHDYYSPELEIIPAVIHAADRVDILLRKERYVLTQVDSLQDYFTSKSGKIFSPDVVDALQGLASIPSFWLDLEYEQYHYADNLEGFRRTLTLDELEELGHLMAVLVDSKSPFTARHSLCVTETAGFMAEKLLMPKDKVRLIRVAGLLHDIGKLAIPDDILMYPGPLSKEQMAVMKQHTYHSYHLISGIGPGAERLARWAAFHHERLDGTGYPFRLSAKELEQESRLIAVADMTQSLLEARPYREAMPPDKVKAILQERVQAKHLDPELADLAIAHIHDIAELVQACSQAS